MTTILRRSLYVSVLVSLLGTTGFAQSGAVKDGDWSDPATWTGGSVPHPNGWTYIGSTSPAGAAATATVTLSADQSALYVYLGYGAGTRGTLDLGDHNVAVGSDLSIGYGGGTGSVVRGAGSLTVKYLRLYSGNVFTFANNDAVNMLYLADNSQATTTGSGVTQWISLNSGSRLTLGADTVLTGGFLANSGTTTLDMGGHSLRANDSIRLGMIYGGSTTIENRGSMHTSDLSIATQTFNLEAADRAYSLSLKSAMSMTASTANIAGGVYLSNDSKLTLGADLSLIDVVRVRDGSIIDAVRHSITAKGIYLGADGTRATSLVNGGPIQVNDLQMTKGSTAAFHPAGTINTSISLSGGSVVTFSQSKGDLTGLTFNGASAGSLAIADTSKLALDFGDNDRPSWIFRWKDPDGGTWEGLLASLIGDGKISVTGYRLYDEGGYTYIASAVPVPATLVGLLQLGGIAAAVVVWRRRWRTKAQ